MSAVRSALMTRDERAAETALAEAWLAVMRARERCDSAGADGEAVRRGLADAVRGIDEALRALRGL